MSASFSDIMGRLRKFTLCFRRQASGWLELLFAGMVDLPQWGRLLPWFFKKLLQGKLGKGDRGEGAICRPA